MFVIERFRVLDYGTWKAAFDDHVEARVRHGGVGHRVFVAENDAKAVTVMLEFASHGGAISLEKYDVSLLDAIRRGGVVGGPHHLQRKVDYLEVADERDYTAWPYA
jgi:hypothetical protein